MIVNQVNSGYISTSVLPGKVSGSLWEGHRLTLGMCDDQEKTTFSCIRYENEKSIKDSIANAYLYEKIRRESYVPLRIKDPQKESVQTVYVPSSLAAALDSSYLCQFDLVLGDQTQERNFLDGVGNIKRIMDRLKDNEFFFVFNQIKAISEEDTTSDSSLSEEELPIQKLKEAIIWKINDRWKIEPVIGLASGSFARVYLTENIALRVLFDQVSSGSALESSSQIHHGKELVRALNQNGTLIGIERPKIGFLSKVCEIDEKRIVKFRVEQVVSERCKGDCLMGGFYPQEVSKMCAQAVEGLKTLHDKGIYHLDIKPSNILYDGDGVVYLADFDPTDTRKLCPSGRG
ncbi:MAG: hypothetical protein V4489_08020 [Chlamydiota bacterium]